MSFARKTLKSLSTSVDTNGAYASLPTFSRSTLNPWFFSRVSRSLSSAEVPYTSNFEKGTPAWAKASAHFSALESTGKVMLDCVCDLCNCSFLLCFSDSRCWETCDFFSCETLHSQILQNRIPDVTFKALLRAQYRRSKALLSFTGGMFYLNDLLLLVFLRNTMKIGNIIPSISKKYAKKATGISQKYHENWKHYSKYF